MNTTTDNDTAGVEAAIEALIAAWNTNQMDRMAALWDRDDPHPIYLAEEEAVAARDWDAVQDYWRRTQALNERIAVEMSNLQVKLTGPDTAIALYNLFWQIKFCRVPKALAGDTRVMVGLHRVAGAWLIHTYMEGATSPITYLRQLYQGRVRPGFEDASTIEG